MKDGSLFKKQNKSKPNCLFLHGRKQKWSHFPLKLCVCGIHGDVVDFIFPFTEEIEQGSSY